MPSNSVLEPLDLSLGRSTKSARKAGDWPEEPNGRQKRVVLMVYFEEVIMNLPGLLMFIGDQSKPSVQPRVNGISRKTSISWDGFGVICPGSKRVEGFPGL